MANYLVQSPPVAGWQPIGSTSTVQNHVLGQVVTAADTTLGVGEFIYLVGVASTIVGSLVRYNATTYQTTLAVNTAVQAVPVAVSMSINLAASFGWYQISGLAVIAKTAIIFGTNVTVFLSATAGQVKAVASAGLQVVGCRTANLASVVSATSTITCAIDRPHLQSQIT